MKKMPQSSRVCLLVLWGCPLPQWSSTKHPKYTPYTVRWFDSCVLLLHILSCVPTGTLRHRHTYAADGDTVDGDDYVWIPNGVALSCHES